MFNKFHADYQFYQVSIDSGNDNTSVTGSIFGEFKPNPLTKLLENVSIGASIISVDSTVDFPEFGNLAIVDEDGRELSILHTLERLLTSFITVRELLMS